MFILGGTSTASLAGVTATLKEWPSLGGLSIASRPVPGRGGRIFGGATQEATEFTFDVIIEGSSVAEVESRRDNFVGLIDPSRGPRAMRVEMDTLWQWDDVIVSDQIEWDRLAWERGTGFMLRADVSFETVGEPRAREVTPQSQTFTTTHSYTLSRGNTSAYPTVEFPSGALATVNIGGFSVVVSATPTGLTNVLDYENFEFYQRNGSGVRVRSLVPYMSHFRRAVLTQGVAATISAVGAPSGTRRIYPNARRI